MLRKTLWSVGLAVLALGIGLGAFTLLASMKKPPANREPDRPTYAVEAYRVDPTDLQEVITAFGTARPYREVVIAAQVAGEVVETYGPTEEGLIETGLKVGQQVRGPEIRTLDSGESKRLEGELLLRIDPKTYQERVEQAQKLLDEDDAELKRLAQERSNNERLLAKAAADLEAYRKEYDRIKRLVEQGSLSESELTKAQLELARYEETKVQRENVKSLFPLRIDQAQRRRMSHQTQLELARLDLARTEVRPPFSGVLSQVMVERGQYVKPGDPLIRLTDPADVEIALPLKLADYAKIEQSLQAGQRPRVELAENETAEPRWRGHVVRRSPQAEESTRTADVFVHVENAAQHSPLLPGTFVHARIEGPVLKQAIVVPRDVIVDGRVFVAEHLKSADKADRGAGSPLQKGSSSASPSGDALAGLAEERTVKLQRTLRTLAVIGGGLNEGELVILTNLDVLHNGAKVRVDVRHRLPDILKRQQIRVVRPHSLAGGKREGRNGASD